MQEIQDSFLRLFNGCRLNEKKAARQSLGEAIPWPIKIISIIIVKIFYSHSIESIMDVYPKDAPGHVIVFKWKLNAERSRFNALLKWSFN